MESICEKVVSVAGAETVATAVERARRALECVAGTQRALETAAAHDHSAKLRLHAHEHLHHQVIMTTPSYIVTVLRLK